LTTFTANSTYYDNTRLSDYKACPRQYFLRHVLGWTVDYGRVAAPLIFGGAWHEGQDAIWRYGNKADQPTLTALAYEAFVKYWVENGYPEDLDDVDYARLNPRIPMVAKEMYWNYIEARGSLLKRCKVLAIEQPFAVPLPNLENCWYVGRLDKVIEDNGQRLVIEHKTTTLYRVQGNFDPNYLDSWWVSSQVKGYQFGAGLYFEGIDGVWVDCALVHKKVHDGFRFVPISHNIALLQEWLVTTQTWAAEVTNATERWKAGESVESCFKKNEDSCYGKYGACQFLDICRTTADPTTLNGVPHGYKEERWEPFDILKLDKLVKQENTND
jgi:hypothetical protein